MIILGKIFMVLVWLLMLCNLVHPFVHPANFILYLALIFIVLVHGLQVWLLYQTRQPNEKMTKQLWGIFFFGVFESLSWKKNDSVAR